MQEKQRLQNQAHQNRIRLQVFFLILASLALYGYNQGSNVAFAQSSAPALSADPGAPLGSCMQQLGYHLALLDSELTESEFNQIDQSEVVGHLQAMELAAGSLMAEAAGESHQYLQEDMNSFISSIIAARRAAAERPPRYYLAGKVAGGCVNCHSVSL